MPEIVYTCPMHSEVKESEPRRCPACGMDLVAADQEPEPAPAEPRGSESSYTRSGGIVAPKFGSAGSGGAEYEPGPKKQD